MKLKCQWEKIPVRLARQFTPHKSEDTWKKSSGIVKVIKGILGFQHYFGHETIWKQFLQPYRQKLNLKDFSETHQRAEILGKIMTLKSGLFIVRAKTCLSGAEFNGPIEVETLKW